MSDVTQVFTELEDERIAPTQRGQTDDAPLPDDDDDDADADDDDDEDTDA